MSFQERLVKPVGGTLYAGNLLWLARRGVTWFQLCPDVCPKVKDILFWLQGSEMSENISLIMGIKLAASHNMGENLC